MKPVGLALIVAMAAVASCDSSGDRPASTFPDPAALSETVAGRVRRGPEPVADVVVRIAPSGNSAGEQGFDAGDRGVTATNTWGMFQFTNAPRLYDLALRSGNESLVYFGLFARYVEPTLGDGPRTRAFTARVRPLVDPPTPAGRELAYFLGGADAVDVTVDASGELVVASKTPANTGTETDPLVLHVVEHPTGMPIALATGYARVPLVVSTEQLTPLPIHVTPVTASALTTRFTIEGPPGASAPAYEVAVHFGQRTASRPVGTTKDGAIAIVPVPNATYFVRARLGVGSATSDSGLVPFTPQDGEWKLELPAPPSTEGFASGALAADAVGVREHVLTAADGSSVHAITLDRAVAIADLARLGAGPTAGTYTWTVTHWPSLTKLDQMTGGDARVLYPSGTTAPVTVAIP